MYSFFNFFLTNFLKFVLLVFVQTHKCNKVVVTRRGIAAILPLSLTNFLFFGTNQFLSGSSFLFLLTVHFSSPFLFWRFQSLSPTRNHLFASAASSASLSSPSSVSTSPSSGFFNLLIVKKNFFSDHFFHFAALFISKRYH